MILSDEIKRLWLLPTQSGSSQAAKAAAQRFAYSAGGASAKPDVRWHYRKSALQRKRAI
jgi:uncharacterized protein (DUF427 family)